MRYKIRLVSHLMYNFINNYITDDFYWYVNIINLVLYILNKIKKRWKV